MTAAITSALSSLSPDRGASRGRWASALRTPVGAVAALLLAVLVLLAALGPLLLGDSAERVDTDHVLEGVSAAHWAGTDNLGRDLLARVVVATRLSLGLAVLATLLAVVIGLVLGATPFLVGRRAGRLITAAVNIAVAFPGLLLALFLAVVFGVGVTGAVLAIGLAGAPSFARLTQTLAAGIAHRDFVSAARIGGASRIRLLLRHVLPNIAEPLVVNATISAGGALLAFAGLSFLGLGVQAPGYDWGRLLQDGLGGIYIHPVGALAPGAAIVLAGLAFNLFGESVAGAIGRTGPVLARIPAAPRGDPGAPARPEADAGSEPGSESDTESDAGSELGSDAGSDADAPVLVVEDLWVAFPGADGPVHPVRGVSFTVRRGEAVGVVGESGSGKSLTALAVARLVEQPGQVTARRLEFLGTDLLSGDTAGHRSLLGTGFAMVFQDPLSSFNPVRRIGQQLAEVAREHQGMSRRAAFARAVDRLRAVRIPGAERRAGQYPHELSGGMRQRAMLGMGLMGSPALIVADEPTTALDVTVQKQVLDLLQGIRAADDVALLLISHDVAVVRQVCDRVLVMYAGQVVEDLPASALADGARHPYTRALVASVPDMHVDLALPLPVIPGRPVDPAHQPAGCAYAARCPLADARTACEDPPLLDDGEGHRVACWHAGEPVPIVIRDTGGVAAATSAARRPA